MAIQTRVADHTIHTLPATSMPMPRILSNRWFVRLTGRSHQIVIQPAGHLVVSI